MKIWGRCLRRRIGVLLFACGVLTLSACAETRITRFGTLADNEALVTLVVTEDLDVVQRECQNVPADGTILGCQMSRPIMLAGHTRHLTSQAFGTEWRRDRCDRVRQGERERDQRRQPQRAS